MSDQPADMWSAIKAYFSATRVAPKPTKPIPVMDLAKGLPEKPSRSVVYRLGHSSMLIGIDGEWVLADPVFSKRASPVQWAGPKRFHPAPMNIDELPKIKAVVISHDHYDHLDKGSIKQLANKVEYFLVPKGLGAYLEKWGVQSERITELSWWESAEIGSIAFTATPTQHFSGRGLFDRNKTLWASWVITGQQANLYFSGDSGYFAGFKEIGDRLGPFDLTMVETGAYNKAWKDIHMMPEESLQAHIDLRGKAMMPIHNATFDLALHNWYEPLERISDLALEEGVSLVTPMFGEGVDVKAPMTTSAWWKSHVVAEDSEFAVAQAQY